MNKPLTGKDIVNLLESWVPKSLAYNWDNVGLQVGTLDRTVHKIMVSLDVLENVVDEAIDRQVDFIIAHHPILFKSLKQIDLKSPKGRIIEKLIKHDITVYAAHTNLDVAHGGVSDVLAGKLGLKDVQVLIPDSYEKLYKLIIYIPASHIEQVKEALASVGVGHIGNYSDCFFQTKGEGSFKPLDGTNPYIGENGQTERVQEAKVETILPEKLLDTAIKAMHHAHPYEEPAYDLVLLSNQGNEIGAGRIGSLEQRITLKTLCQLVKNQLDVPTIRVIGNLDATVQKIAVLGGSGEDYIDTAKSKGADVYITGDMTFHDAQDAEQMGLHVIDPGHYVERFMKQAVQKYVIEKLNRSDGAPEVIVSEVNTDPFQFI